MVTLPETPSRLSDDAGLKRDLAQAILDAQSTQHPHGVRALLDACAHARELVGLLVDVHRDAARRSAAATARPPMPAPMIAMERTGFPTDDAPLLFERDIGGLDHAAPVRDFLLDVGAECLGRAGQKLDLGGGGFEPLAQRA